nr:hypothetical protein [Vibrio parahaemolyticus]
MIDVAANVSAIFFIFMCFLSNDSLASIRLGDSEVSGAILIAKITSCLRVLE